MTDKEKRYIERCRKERQLQLTKQARWKIAYYCEIMRKQK